MATLLASQLSTPVEHFAFYKTFGNVCRHGNDDHPFLRNPINIRSAMLDVWALEF